jgi:hypothetical protein
MRVLLYGQQSVAVEEWDYNDGEEEVRSGMRVNVKGDCKKPGRLNSFRNIWLRISKKCIIHMQES